MRALPRLATIIVVTLFLTIAAHAAWDWVETRRLVASVETIKANEKPISRQQLKAGLQGDNANADRYYRAAAALASASGQWYPRSMGALGEAMRMGTLTPDMLAEIRKLVAEEPHATALRLLDQATALPFNGLVPRSSGGGQVIVDLMQLKELSDERTTVLAIDGEGDAAATSLVGGFRLVNVLRSTMNVGVGWRFTVDAVGRTVFVLSRTQPAQTTLQRLATSAAEADANIDDTLKRLFEDRRTRTIPRPGAATRTGVGAWSVLRPVNTRRLRLSIDRLTAMSDAMALPWPDRLDAVARLTGVDSLLVTGTVAEGAGALALVRCTGAVIAIEGYRRDHGGAVPTRLAELVPAYLPSVPVDPFSGEELKYTTGPSQYSVYSVWLDRADNRNILTPRDYAQPGNSYLQSAQDFGVVIPLVQHQAQR